MILSSLSYRATLTSLQKNWVVYVALCGIFLAGGWLFLRQAWHTDYALRWVGLTMPVLAYQIWLLRRSLAYNHRPEEQALFPGLGWGNAFTLLRGVFFAGLTGFLFSPLPEGGLAWIPAILYTMGVLIDIVDGYAARKTNQVTCLGEILDMSMDGWGILVAATLAVQYGQVPAWYLLVGWARYLYMGGFWLRKRLGWPILELPASANRRPFAGLQMGFAFVMLWPVFTPPGTFHAATFFSLPFLVNFLNDWLVVSGTIPADFSQRLEGIKNFSLGWLPLGLRLSVALILAWQWSGLAENLGGAQFTFWAVAALEGLALLFILMGAAGRIAAITGLVALGLHQLAAPLTAIQLTLAWLYGAILYLGTGAFSAWKPEDRLIYPKDGE